MVYDAFHLLFQLFGVMVVGLVLGVLIYWTGVALLWMRFGLRDRWLEPRVFWELQNLPAGKGLRAYEVSRALTKSYDGIYGLEWRLKFLAMRGLLYHQGGAYPQAFTITDRGREHLKKSQAKSREMERTIWT